LQESAKNKFAVADHLDFDKDLANLDLSPSALVPGQSLESVTPHLGIDVVVTGTIAKRGNSYVLEIVPIRISGEKSLSPLPPPSRPPSFSAALSLRCQLTFPVFQEKIIQRNSGCLAAFTAHTRPIAN
jgi:hypothetical protein